MRALAHALVAVIACLAVPTSASAFGELREWGGRGSAPGQLSAPTGVAVASDGSIYVLDSSNSRVQQFSPTGQLISSWGDSGTDDGQLDLPRGIALARDGQVYVSDTGNNRIEHFSPAGVFVDSFGATELSDPTGLALDADGRIFVADRKHDRIALFLPNGTPFRWSSRDTATLSRPHHVAVTDSAVYVADSRGIERFDKSGTLIWQHPGSFSYDAGLAVDATGNVYAGREGIDTRIDEFSPDGALIGSFGAYGSGTNQFEDPFGLAVDCRFNVFVADTYLNVVKKFGAAPETFSPCASQPLQPPPPDAQLPAPPVDETQPAEVGVKPVPLRLVVRAGRHQRIGHRRLLLVTVGCDRTCDVSLTARIKIHRRTIAIIRAVRSGIPSRVLAAVHLRVPRLAAKRLAALRGRDYAQATITTRAKAGAFDARSVAAIARIR
jgi:DNA-binding beta-propeller fold protein YncE